MSSTIRILTALTLFAAVPAAAQDARDYQLPPAATPSGNNRAQGPIDPDAPVAIRPRVILGAAGTAPGATSAATPVARSTATPASTAGPVAARPASTVPAPATRSSSPQARPSPRPSPSAQTKADQTPAPALASPAPAPATAFPASPRPAPANPAGAPPLPWAWIGVAGVVLAIIVALAIAHRRRRAITPPPIERYLPPVGDTLPGALAITVEAMRLDRSLMNATLGYRVTIRNRSAQPLGDVGVEADLVSASRDLPPERQLASTLQPLPRLHSAQRLGPGQSLRFDGQVRLPLSQASPIWQGRVGLLVPLLRVRATAAGADAVATTLVIGTADGASARPQPFRLDEPPRSYAPLAQRVLDPAPVQA